MEEGAAAAAASAAEWVTVGVALPVSAVAMLPTAPLEAAVAVAAGLAVVETEAAPAG